MNKSLSFQYSTGKDGSTVGVTVTRNGILSHCRTLTVACNYTEGEVMVCVLDFKRDVGLWHGILCVSMIKTKYCYRLLLIHREC